MALSLSFGLSYTDFLSMTMNEVLAFSEKVQQVRELQNYDLAVKIGQLFSEDGLQPPNYITKSTNTTPIRDASELSDEERAYWVNKIVDFQIRQVDKYKESGVI